MDLILIVGIALVFWLIIIRPQQRRQKTIREMQSALAVGDDVMLTSGVYATVAEITDDHVAVEVAPGVVLRVVRGAIGSVVPKPEEEPEGSETTDELTADDQGDDRPATEQGEN